MGKRILGWLRQRRVAVMYVVLKLLLWGTITCSLLWTIVVMLGHSNGGSYVALCMHIVSIIILVVLCPLGVSHAGKNEKRFIKLLQLFQFAVFAFVFVAVFETVGSATMSFYIGSPGSGVISGYEALHQLGSVTPPRAGVTPLSNMPNRGHSLPTHHNRQHRTQPHDLEIIAPIPRKSRCTRYVALHPLRRAAPDQNGCNAYGSGAPPPTTSTTAGFRL